MPGKSCWFSSAFHFLPPKPVSHWLPATVSGHCWHKHLADSECFVLEKLFNMNHTNSLQQTKEESWWLVVKTSQLWKVFLTAVIVDGECIISGVTTRARIIVKIASHSELRKNHFVYQAAWSETVTSFLTTKSGGPQ